ncbi:hypothetical protein ACOSQ2_021112 [Xanthoceras sorbifolium]
MLMQAVEYNYKTAIDYMESTNFLTSKDHKEEGLEQVDGDHPHAEKGMQRPSLKLISRLWRAPILHLW